MGSPSFRELPDGARQQEGPIHITSEQRTEPVFRGIATPFCGMVRNDRKRK